jgi:hypothetical protein
MEDAHAVARLDVAEHEPSGLVTHLRRSIAAPEPA